MKIACFIFCVFLVSCLSAQDENIQHQIKFTTDEAVKQGFELVDKGGENTNALNSVSFDYKLFPKGYIYYVVVFIEGCNNCNFVMQYWNYATDKQHNLDPTLRRSNSYLRAEYSFSQKKDTQIRFDNYVNQTGSFFTYVLLFRKPL